MSKLGYRTVEYLLDLLNLERAPIRILIKVSLDTRSTVSSTVEAILEVMYSYFQFRAKIGYFKAWIHLLILRFHCPHYSDLSVYYLDSLE